MKRAHRVYSLEFNKKAIELSYARDSALDLSHSLLMEVFYEFKCGDIGYIILSFSLPTLILETDLKINFHLFNCKTH